jgi:hypothetical protein
VIVDVIVIAPVIVIDPRDRDRARSRERKRGRDRRYRDVAETVNAQRSQRIDELRQIATVRCATGRA